MGSGAKNKGMTFVEIENVVPLPRFCHCTCTRIREDKVR